MTKPTKVPKPVRAFLGTGRSHFTHFPRTSKHDRPVLIIDPRRTATVPTAAIAEAQRAAYDNSKHPYFRRGSQQMLDMLGLLPKPAKPVKKCRTCNGTGLADSGVPSMPMPCPKCAKKPTKRRTSRK